MSIRLLILSLILIVLGQTPLIAPLRAVSASVANPVQYSAYRLSQNLKRELEFVANLRRLRVENIGFTERLLELESVLAVNKELQEENNLLREQLNVGENAEKQTLVLAAIVGRSARGGEATLTINKGSEHGLREASAVVLKNLLLGEVFSVEPKRAKVRLLTDPQFVAAALDQDSPDRARGLVSGQYGTAIILQRVLPTESLAVGDVVVTSGEDGKFEKGLVLGVVRKILTSETAVFKAAELELVVAPDSLEEVFVVK